MTHAEQVPVKIGSVTVGSATVNSDGTIDIRMSGPSDGGKELLESIVVGHVSALSIQPVSIPAQRQSSDQIDFNDPDLRETFKRIEERTGIYLGYRPTRP